MVVKLEINEDQRAGHRTDSAARAEDEDRALVEKVLFADEHSYNPYLLPTRGSLNPAELTDAQVQEYCTPVAVGRFMNAVLLEENVIRTANHFEEDVVKMDTDISRDQLITTKDGKLYVYVSKSENPVTKFHMSYHEDISKRTVIFNASYNNRGSGLIEATYLNSTRPLSLDSMDNSGAMIKYPVKDSPANARAFLQGQIWVAQVIGAMREAPKLTGMTVPLPKKIA